VWKALVNAVSLTTPARCKSFFLFNTKIRAHHLVGARTASLSVATDFAPYPHKLRIAITGSTLVARRAGTKHATSATPGNKSEISANVIGSVALTP
jgi:hypothetical protein